MSFFGFCELIKEAYAYFQAQNLLIFWKAVRRQQVTFRWKRNLQLIEPNGSGKTTIFNLINNYFPDFRKISFNGSRLIAQTHDLGGIVDFSVVKPLAG
jgi:ABC-type branched-subunit amino acid transport system ATPase component